jgi:hypothetical protein
MAVVVGDSADRNPDADANTEPFAPLLSTALPVGRGACACGSCQADPRPTHNTYIHLHTHTHPGASFSCPGDGTRLLLLQNYVGLAGRPTGRLSTLRKQTPLEAMLSLGKAGKVRVWV